MASLSACILIPGNDISERDTEGRGAGPRRPEGARRLKRQRNPKQPVPRAAGIPPKQT
jgi:hypothetical protein